MGESEQMKETRLIEAWFDGACEPVNPGGTASYGVIVTRNGETSTSVRPCTHHLMAAKHPTTWPSMPRSSLFSNISSTMP